MSHLLTSALVALLAATLVAWFAALLHENGLGPVRRFAESLPPKRPFQTLILAAVALGMIHHGATKTNNVPDRVGGEPHRGGALPEEPPAAFTNADWLAFGACEDWFRVATDGWCFRFGTGLVESVTVLACGEIRAGTADSSNRISVLGVPLSLLPAARWGEAAVTESLFWHEETPSNTLLLAWANALANRDTNAPVTVIAELSRDGAAAFRYDFSAVSDVSALTNAATKVWRDGTEECVPLMTGAVVAVDFAAPPVTGTNALDEVCARMDGGNSNAYYFAEAAVERGPARIRVASVGESTLGGYEIMAEPGATNRLPLLIGEKYEVSGETAFSHFALEESALQTEASFPSATNLTDRLVAVEWPLKFALEEVAVGAEAVTYAVCVAPGGLGGEFVWGGATGGNMRGSVGARSAGGCAACGTPPMRSGGGCGCGCISAESNLVTHASSCACDECELEGCYRYEGRTECFELPFDDEYDPAGEGGDGGEGNDPDQPDPPWVSLAFEDNVVIFEDEYENSPGVTVPRQSTRTKLTLTAHGGDDGCTFSLTDSEKLQRVAGSPSPPSSVAPGEDIEWSAYYEGKAASAQMNDATAHATYTNSRTGEKGSTGDITATVVEIEVSSNSLKPIECRNRHIYGICEQLQLAWRPTGMQLQWNANGIGTWKGAGQGWRYFQCPDFATQFSLIASCGGVTFPVDISSKTPEQVCCSLTPEFLQKLELGHGQAGDAGMMLIFTVCPTNVSFENVRFTEVPSIEGTNSGYFSELRWQNDWYHGTEQGAGRIVVLNEDNDGEDEAYLGFCSPPFSHGTMVWGIPVAWQPPAGSGSNRGMTQFAHYDQQFVFTSEGTLSVSKFDHTAERGTNTVKRIDGEVVP